ncbi:MAG: hypothetical protein WCI79_01665 [Candidatus Saccharibacteria bacterium]
MNKDVIYIDTEDDITSIIGKIKASKEKIVALVPPKRIGVLQSAVNLRLLSRTATNSGKHLVLITSNRALIALSAASMVPIAKNLQSKPEIAEVEELDTDEADDIIDGSDLPIGELAKTADGAESDDVSMVIDSIDIDKEASTETKIPFKNKLKVPNFSDFRKKIFIGGGIALALVIFIVWAIVFAPAATVIITAKASPAPVSATLKIGSVDATDITKGTIQTVSKQIKKDVSVEFTPTGKKDLGEKAKGTIDVQNCDNNLSIPIKVGTVFVASSGEHFVNTSAIDIPGFTGSASECRNTGKGAGTASIPVEAEQAGAAYNIDAKNYTITGVSGDVYSSGSAMAGGTTKLATVPTAEDIQKASQTLVDLPSDDVRAQLVAQFTNSEIVINESFNIERAAAVSVPAVNTEATGKVKLTSATTYTIMAIAKSEMENYLNTVLAKQVGQNQRIYDNGVDHIKMSGYLRNDSGQSINISTIGQIGPKIDEAAIKEQIKGKRYGDVQSIISGVQGVVSVDTKFPYFWINTVPNEINKIDIQFRIQND